MKHKIKIISLTLLLMCSYGPLLQLWGKNPEIDKIETTYDVIIVPGVPYNDDFWTDILLGRIYWSHYLYEKGITKNIIYSGSAVYTPYIESEIMAMYGEQLGIPASDIFTETRAEHSVENVYYSYNLARKLGFKKIALATDSFQSRMVKRPSKRMNVNIEFIPFSVKMLDTLNLNSLKNISINAQNAYVKDFVSLEERKNFFQRLKGTLGRNIDFKE
ncbi:MAG TPA: YdcF family protein [Bacteroidales bacterium]|nr:YdcF family protein [Bacteroidales bacterium]